MWITHAQTRKQRSKSGSKPTPGSTLGSESTPGPKAELCVCRDPRASHLDGAGPCYARCRNPRTGEWEFCGCGCYIPSSSKVSMGTGTHRTHAHDIY